MGLRVLNEDGEEVTPIMGSYGIGIERILSAAIELYHDKDGMVLPACDRAVHGGGHAGELSPMRRSARRPKRSIETCLALGIDALLDDRDERPGREVQGCGPDRHSVSHHGRQEAGARAGGVRAAARQDIV